MYRAFFSRPPAPKPSSWKQVLLVSLLPSAALPLGLALLADLFWEHERWVSEPLHALLEGAGSFAAIMLAAYILIMQRSGRLQPGYLWIATTLIGMGLLDGFHAGLHPGQAFVWLHSLATLVGGLTFAMIVVSDRYHLHARLRDAPFWMALLSLLVGMMSVIWPERIPAMILDGEFTTTAVWINALGGLGFILAWGHFTRSEQFGNPGERLLLANHCLLFGIAGLLFHFSSLWDVTWWLWHLLRLLAYLAILWFFLDLFHHDMRVIRQQRDDLEMTSSVFQNASEGIMITDQDAVILSVNAAFTEITGHAAEEAIGSTPKLMRSDRQDSAFYDKFWADLAREGRWQGEIWNRRKSGEAFLAWQTINAIRDAQGRPQRYISIFHDITHLHLEDERIRHMAFHDALTGLPNRALFLERVEHSLERWQRDGGKLAVLFIDLDGFKAVNDTHGHDIGDLVLQEVAHRIRACVRRGLDTVARLGGDEFVVLLEGVHDEHCRTLAEALIRSVSSPIEAEGLPSLHVGASVGIATCPEHGESVQELMRAADAAMYAVKLAGKNTYRFAEAFPPG